MEEILEYYEEAFEKTKDPVAASLLVLANEIDGSSRVLDHKIALGIRHGIFGSEASDKASVMGMDRFPVDISGSVKIDED